MTEPEAEKPLTVETNALPPTLRSPESIRDPETDRDEEVKEALTDKLLPSLKADDTDKELPRTVLPAIDTPEEMTGTYADIVDR